MEIEHDWKREWKDMPEFYSPKKNLKKNWVEDLTFKNRYIIFASTKSGGGVVRRTERLGTVWIPIK